MASRFQAAALAGAPSYPNAVVWSEENLIAVASGHVVTILNAASLDGPRCRITVPSEKPFPIGFVDTKDLISGSLLPTCLSRERQPCVRSVSWSPLGMAPNSGCLLAVCTTEGRVKLYRPPFCDYSAEWIEVMDISERLYEYLGSINFAELDSPSNLCPEQPIETQCCDDPLLNSCNTESACSDDPPRTYSLRQRKRQKVDITCEFEDPVISEDQLLDPIDNWNADTSYGPYMELEQQALVKVPGTISDCLKENSERQIVTISKSKSTVQKKVPENCTQSLITAGQYASRSAMLSSVVVAWSPMLPSSSGLCTVPNDRSSTPFSLLAVGGKSGKISIWRIHAPQSYSIDQSGVSPAATLIGLFDAHDSYITAINWAFNSSDISDSPILVTTGSSDGRVKIWQASSDELLKSTSSHATFHLLKEVVAAGGFLVSALSTIIPVRSPHKMFMAVGKGSGSFDIWVCDISNCKFDIAGSYDAHDRVVTGLGWAFDGCCLYSCGQDNVIRNWILHGSSLHEMPIPPNIPGLGCSSDLPDVFDSCFGVAFSPGSLAAAVVRSFDANLLNPMYQVRSQKAAVEFFWLGGQQMNILSDPSVEFSIERAPHPPENFAFWESNILWSLKQYENLNKRLVLWDIIAALLALKRTAPKFVERVLVKWFSVSYLKSCSLLSSKNVVNEVSKCLGKVSTRLLHLLNIISRRLMLSHLEADEISRKVCNLGQSDVEVEEDTSMWMELLISSERELRERLVFFSFSSVVCTAYQSARGIPQPERWSPAGLAQMEQWIQLNTDHVHDELKNVASEFRKCDGRLHSNEYVKKERCSYCSSSVPFESPEFAFCRGVERKTGVRQRHKLARCAVSMCVCPATPLWFCMCCQRQVFKMPPEALFKMCERPLDYSSIRTSVPSKPLCPFCGIQLQRVQTEFLLSLSPV